ncbi:Hypothetical predicted protein, partial [Podarcis lilfordi]
AKQEVSYSHFTDVKAETKEELLDCDVVVFTNRLELQKVREQRSASQKENQNQPSALHAESVLETMTAGKAGYLLQ